MHVRMYEYTEIIFKLFELSFEVEVAWILWNGSL